MDAYVGPADGHRADAGTLAPTLSDVMAALGATRGDTAHGPSTAGPSATHATPRTSVERISSDTHDDAEDAQARGDFVMSALSCEAPACSATPSRELSLSSSLTSSLNPTPSRMRRLTSNITPRGTPSRMRRGVHRVKFVNSNSPDAEKQKLAEEKLRRRTI